MPQSINWRKFILVLPLEIWRAFIISSIDRGLVEINNKAWICAMALFIPHNEPKLPQVLMNFIFASSYFIGQIYE